MYHASPDVGFPCPSPERSLTDHGVPVVFTEVSPEVVSLLSDERKMKKDP